MFLIKALFGCIIGGVVGFLGGLIPALLVFIIVGLGSRNESTGKDAATIVSNLCVLIGAGIGLCIPLKAEVDRQKSEENVAENRKSYLSNLLTTSRSDFQNIPTLVAAADEHLNLAEREFAEGAFAPFWDQIEYATNKLATYQQRIQIIKRNAIEYSQAICTSTNMPAFSVPTGQLPDARPTASRLAGIVRKAQKNFQFATIYEQRKTNQILVEGFGTLASAINSLGDSISGSLHDLSTTLNVSLERILQQAEADASVRRQVTQRQAEANAMLDNIQRKRKPFP